MAARHARTGLAALLAAVAACGGGEPAPPRSPAPVFVAQPGVAPPPLPPLPQGWAWPFDPAAAARGMLAPLTVFRPVNVNALRATALRAPNPCGTVEVAPNVWITPMCGHLGIGRANRTRRSMAPMAPPMAPMPQTALPEYVDLRAMGLDGPMKHQQSAPVCWSFAFTNVMENALRRAGRTDVIAPLHLVAHYEWQTVQRTSATGGPTTLETTWPYDPHKACKLDQNSSQSDSCETAYGIKRGSWREDPDLVAETQRMDAAGAYRISAIQSLKDTPGDPHEIAVTLAGGQAIYAELEFNARAWSMPSSGRMDTIPDWEPDGVGGHAVTFVGYTTVNGRRMFLLHNSWGPTWGEGGYAWISEAMVRARLVDAWTVTLTDAQGRVVTPNGNRTTPPPPPPPPPPQPQTGGRTHCQIVNFVRIKPGEERSIPVGEATCAPGETGKPNTLLIQCRRVSSGLSNCAAAMNGGGLCVPMTVGGRNSAACCPPGVTNPTDPRCKPADALHPPRPND